MKKIYFLALSLISIASFGQIQNGSFENWTDGTPDGWLITLGSNGGEVVQETTLHQSGASSVKLVAPNGTGNNRVGYTDVGVVAGEDYTISYWYYDQDDNARMRHWGSFRDAAGALPSGSQPVAFQPTTYNANTTGWQQVTVTATAPAGATFLRIDFRVFQQATDQGGGSVYVDNVAVTGNLRTAQNSISGLKVYPNPVSNGTLYIDTDNGTTKDVAIFDLLGKQVVKTSTEQTVNVSGLKTGVYMVKITEEGKTATRKLIIK